MKLCIKESFDDITYYGVLVKINGKVYRLLYESYPATEEYKQALKSLPNKLLNEIRKADGTESLSELYDAISSAAYVDTNLSTDIDGSPITYINNKPVDYSKIGDIYINWDDEECGYEKYYENVYLDYYDNVFSDEEREIYNTFDYWFHSITDKNGSVNYINNLYR